MWMRSDVCFEHVNFFAHVEDLSFHLFLTLYGLCFLLSLPSNATFPLSSSGFSSCGDHPVELENRISIPRRRLRDNPGSMVSTNIATLPGDVLRCDSFNFY